ncbi:anthrone oxygenase family protein [Streptosporangium sp. NBC_01469]|uniref:anthrone oxygenase family protein n=1 Tax=Streptosporangium sp. NBC_01469 TaxID=2903898 RepID=UPI002E29027A|nr:anthrone oxygenase family protein [Streptosporangium sp. NBC_01469]
MLMFRGLALVAAAITTGLIAGLFYAYTCSVMPGLARTDDRTLISTMQQINVAILNGWFAICFGGALVLTVLSAALHLQEGGRAVLPWIVAGLVLYVVMLAITMVIHVPLNTALDAAGDPDRITDLAAVREQFEAAWVRWNLIRTLASVAAFGCLAWALVVYGRTSLPNGS